MSDGDHGRDHPRDYRHSGGRGPFRVQAADKAGNYLTLTYFNNPGWAKKQLPLGEPKMVSGRLDRYGQELQMVHPDHVLPSRRSRLAAGPRARLPTVGRPHEQSPRPARLASLGAGAGAPEWIEPSLIERRGWPAWGASLQLAHRTHDRDAARERLAYDEVFANQLALTLVRGAARRRRGVPLRGDGRLRDALELPYQPTGAQARTIREIEGDLAQEVPMLRLLQGDVGSGKTLVALMALLIAVEAGAQGALLAPTEILARQHFDTLSRQLTGLGIHVAILTGRDKGRARESTMMGLATARSTSWSARTPSFRRRSSIAGSALP
jgi:ATP-dependent DNA helicase RecG